MAQLEGNNIDIISLHKYCKKQSFTSKSSQTKTMGWKRGGKRAIIPTGTSSYKIPTEIHRDK